MPEKSRSAPAIHLPPPLILLTGFLAGVGIDSAFPIPVHASHPGGLWSIMRWTLIGLGSAFSFWGFITFVRARTGVLPNQAVTGVVTHGPYYFSRNPMYTGLSLAYIGFTVWLNSLWPLVMLPLSLWVLWKAVIQREEIYLATAFGEEYESYKKQVRRWL